jgi:trigger factor
MNITKNSIDELNAVVTIKIEKPDYEERVDKILKDYRRKARFDGFRPGKVPQGLVNKIYRKPVLIEEVNKILSESLGKYFVDEKLQILGEPLPHSNEMNQINWDNDAEFEFSFDIGLSPELDFTVTGKDKIPYYLIKVDEEERNKQIDRIRIRYGVYNDVGEITDNELIKADLIEVNNKDEEVEGGLHVENASIGLEYIKDARIRKKFTGCKAGDQVVINVKKAFENETDLAALLKIDKGKLGDIINDFKVIIKSVSKFEKAEINQDLFDKLYGKDTVKTEEEFNHKVEEELKSAFKQNSDYKFRLDAKNFYLSKFIQDLPVEFLKRWLMHTGEDKINREQIDKDFEHFATNLKWQLIKGKVIRENELKPTEDELLAYAMNVLRQQFVQYYGITEVPVPTLEKYARESLSKEEERNKYSEGLLEDKVFEFIQKTGKLDTKEVTLDKFNKMFEK